MNPYFARLAQRGGDGAAPAAPAASVAGAEHSPGAEPSLAADFAEVDQWAETPAPDMTSALPAAEATATPSPVAHAAPAIAEPALGKASATRATEPTEAAQIAMPVRAAPAPILPAAETPAVSMPTPNMATVALPSPIEAAASVTPSLADDRREQPAPEKPSARAQAPVARPPSAPTLRALPRATHATLAPSAMTLPDAAPPAQDTQDTPAPVAATPVRPARPASAAQPLRAAPIASAPVAAPAPHWQIQIGRVELDIVGAPAPTPAAPPAPAATAPTAPRSTFNPRRHYLRSG